MIKQINQIIEIQDSRFFKNTGFNNPALSVQ